MNHIRLVSGRLFPKQEWGWNGGNEQERVGGGNEQERVGGGKGSHRRKEGREKGEWEY